MESIRGFFHWSPIVGPAFGCVHSSSHGFFRGSTKSNGSNSSFLNQEISLQMPVEGGNLSENKTHLKFTLIPHQEPPNSASGVIFQPNKKIALEKPKESLPGNAAGDLFLRWLKWPFIKSSDPQLKNQSRSRLGSPGPYFPCWRV